MGTQQNKDLQKKKVTGNSTGESSQTSTGELSLRSLAIQALVNCTGGASWTVSRS